VTGAIIAALEGAHTACILPGVLVIRAGVRDALQSFVDASGLPFATMFMDKSVLEEQHPSYMGMYDGKLMASITTIAAITTDNSRSHTADFSRLFPIWVKLN
jgi:TPP-dependent 2-oxoacid decarboxylase